MIIVAIDIDRQKIDSVRSDTLCCQQTVETAGPCSRDIGMNSFHSRKAADGLLQPQKSITVPFNQQGRPA